MSEIRTFPIVTPARSTPITISIANLYTRFALVLPNEPKSEDESDDPLETSPIITILSTLSSDDPFPRPNPENGNPRFCMKTYTENEGVLEQLLSNGPLVEVLLDDREISHACLNCIEKKGVLGAKFELLGKERLMRCSGCKKCQRQGLGEIIRKACKVWKVDRSDATRLMENKRRADMKQYLDGAGFQTINLGS
ncbi:hypothetical protein BT96DRAFT_946193 [Gymnopus androsaceus JB14]|uniref:Uncharacterized protein n=1 Tax=Gymnopus androsaceus JB14 TaxID=1447944 RepID=A0A6A4GWQ8_9AGAR|nr:hypothetical protein BT96DRAFT_946193 [Gymnopus androsaceus JB14]